MTSFNTNNDVATFLSAAGQDVNTALISDWKSSPQAELYKKLCEEEFTELIDAWNETDVVEVADAIADLIWVLQGLALSIGVPQQAVWDEVARSNLAKIDSVTGKVLKRADGKVQKPDGWTPPDIRSILFKE
jgi:NTP pyrophosphatase (non-canonical NTP hydrolase)